MYEKIKEKVLEFVLNNKLICFLVGVTVLSITFSALYVHLNKCPKCEVCKKTPVIKKNSNKKEIKTVIVDVKGEVNLPGVYTLKEGLSVIDAINASGGLTDKATTKNINLSKRLEDEMVIYVFSEEEISRESESENMTTIPNIDYTSPNTVDKKDSKKRSDAININTAGIDDLTTLTGIGPAKAKKIIEYRESNGNFKTIEEIKNVSGIGDKAFEKIKDYIKV